MEKIVIPSEEIKNIERKFRRDLLINSGLYNIYKNKTHKSKKSYKRNKSIKYD